MTARAVEIQGHRGARGLAPENTLAGFARALDIGVDTLELDVALTRDGVVVVHHDPTLNPDTTRDPTGAWVSPDERVPVMSLTLEALRRYDVGAARPGSPVARRFPEQVPAPGARIPTLAEVIDLARRAGVRLNVEVKSRPVTPALTPPPQPFADAVVTVLREAGMEQHAAIQSFDWRVPAQVQRTAPAIAIGHLSQQHGDGDTIGGGGHGPSPWTAGLDADAFDGSVPRMVRAAGGRTWLPDYRDLDAARLAEARALGLRVVVWTVNAPQDMDRMLALGVDGIITDYPDRAREALARAGLPLPRSRD